MRRGTTPALMLKIPGRDLRDCTIFVTVKRSKKLMVNKTNDSISVAYDGTDSTLIVRFTQEDTLSLKTGTAEIQVRWINAQDHAEATKEKELDISGVLYEEVIEYVG